MKEPLILVFKFNVTLQGIFDDFTRYAKELVEFVESEEPRLIAFEIYANDDGSQVTTVLIHPDAESEDFHYQVAAEKMKEGQQYFADLAIDVYGSPSDTILQNLNQMADSGVPVRVNTNHLGGFSRWR